MSETRPNIFFDYFGRKVLDKYYSDNHFYDLPAPMVPPPRATTGDGAGAADAIHVSKLSSPKVKADVCIVGAGAAGMYAAMLIDLVNERFADYRVSYDILEASDRVGGRLYTYEFPDPERTNPERTNPERTNPERTNPERTNPERTNPERTNHDTNYNYIDVGAMRFPNTPFMARTFNLFKYLKIEDQLLPYKIVSKNTFLHYNGIRVKRKDIAEGTSDSDDPFRVMDGNGGDVLRWGSEEAFKKGPRAVVEEALKELTDGLLNDMENGTTSGLKALMKYDDHSTRSYLRFKKGYPTSTINWLETREGGTAWYDQALSETVLESLAFNYPGEAPKSDDDINKDWHCIRGGTKVLANAMEAKLKGTVTKNTRVTAIGLQNFQDLDSTILVTSVTSAKAEPTKTSSADSDLKITQTTSADSDPKTTQTTSADSDPKTTQTTSADSDPKTTQTTSADSDPKTTKTTKTTYAYSEVICTAPLPVIRTMDLDKCYLDYGQSNALRQLQYGPSTKIGMKFKSRWWETRLGIVGGQSYSDRTIRTVVYPSYGSKEGAGSIIVSYAWTMDALRLGSLIENDKPVNPQLVDIILTDLAAIHDLSYDFLQSQLDHTYAYDWYGNPLTMGAFAFFGPGQFQQVYENLTRPAADGKLLFAGEALSTRHAWVVGALASAWRAVYQLYLKRFELMDISDISGKKPPAKVLEFLTGQHELGYFGEWNVEHILRQVAISKDKFDKMKKERRGVP